MATRKLKFIYGSHYSSIRLRPIMNSCLFKTLWKLLYCYLKLASQDHVTVALSDIFLVSPQALDTPDIHTAFTCYALCQPISRLFALSVLPNKNPSLLLYDPSSPVQIPSSLRNIPIYLQHLLCNSELMNSLIHSENN